MGAVSKAQRIRALYAQGKTCNEIADIVGCLPEYARVCAQQRRRGALSKADEAYMMRRYGGKTAVEAQRLKSKERDADPEQREKRCAYMRDYNKDYKQGIRRRAALEVA